MHFVDIVDMLEDDVEHMHEKFARIETRVSRMKNKGQHAYVHSKAEKFKVVQMIKDKSKESQMAAKCVVNSRSPELCALTRVKQSK
jgi:hypothetical protein